MKIPGSHLYSIVLKVAQVTDNVTHIVPLYWRLHYDLVEGEVFLRFIDSVCVVIYRIAQVDPQAIRGGGVVRQ